MRRFALAAMLFCGHAASAQQPSEAVKLFEQGRVLAAQGDYVHACEIFEKSMQLDHAGGTEANLADCQEHLGHFAKAHALFVDAAELSDRDHNDALAKVAREHAAALEGKLATVIVKIPDPAAPELQVMIANEVVPAAAEVKQLVDPGAVEVVVTAAGRPRFARTQQIAAGATAIFDTAVAEPRPEHPPAEAERDRGRVHIAMALAGGAALTGIVGIAFAYVGRNNYNDTANGPLCMHVGSDLKCYPDGITKINSALTLEDVATGCAIATAALGIAAGIVYFTAPHVAISPTASRNGAGVSIAGRF